MVSNTSLRRVRVKFSSIAWKVSCLPHSSLRVNDEGYARSLGQAEEPLSNVVGLAHLALRVAQDRVLKHPR